MFVKKKYFEALKVELAEVKADHAVQEKCIDKLTKDLLEAAKSSKDKDKAIVALRTQVATLQQELDDIKAKKIETARKAAEARWAKKAAQ